MDLSQFIKNDNEKPLDNLPADGGFTKIFRTIGCIGDSLASGEFESLDEEGNRGYHDYFEYSWGQYIARASGVKVFNFSRGGMTAKEYWDSFADSHGYWSEDIKCQAYIIALGVNDIFGEDGMEIGSVNDIDIENYNNNKENFAGYYARIIQRIKSYQPKARFFLMTMPRAENEERNKKQGEHAKLLYDMAELFDYTYVIDLMKYAPVYDEEFRRNFYLGGHLNASGYVLTGRMVSAYIDYIVRNNPEDFAQVGFIGKDVHNSGAKW